MSQQQQQDINVMVLPEIMEKLSMSQTKVRRMSRELNLENFDIWCEIEINQEEFINLKISQITGCDINCVKRLVENPLRRFKILLQEQDNRRQSSARKQQNGTQNVQNLNEMITQENRVNSSGLRQ
jgi:hypothetical protein